MGALVLAGGALLLAGCAPSVVGKWQGSFPVAGQSLPITTEFKKDNTISQSISAPMFGQVQSNGTYKTEGEKLTVTITQISIGGKDVTSKLPPQMKSSMETSGTFKVEGDKLTVTGNNGTPTTFNKVKE